jgi:hypothetical protein
MVDLIRSPRQATNIFGLDNGSVPRKKSLFFVRFRRTDNAQATKSGWQDNLGYMVKSIERPSVSPQIEELNQYGKKRQVTTGYKHQDARIVLFDTSDSMALRMWVEYSRWYFGDFAQDDETAWRYDITMDETNDNGGGFGFSPTDVRDSIKDLNSQFFFDAVEVYQVWGGYYTQFDLVNPKIKSFDPDELDYEITSPSTVSVTLAYEAMIHRNDGAPMLVSSNESVAAVFGGLYNGGTFTVDSGTGTTFRPPFPTAPKTPPVSVTSFTNKTLGGIISSALHTTGSSTGGGSLGIFGKYNFGALTKAVGVNTGSLAGDISYLATGNPTLTTLLNMPTSSLASTVVRAISGNGNPISSAGINGSLLDNAQSTILRIATPVANQYAKDFINKNVLGGTTGAALITGQSPVDKVSAGASGGLVLNTDALAIINATRPSSSQMGVNTSAGDTTNGVSDGTPSGTLPPTTSV